MAKAPKPMSVEHLPTDDQLEYLYIRGQKIRSSDLADLVLSADASVSMSQISEVSIGIYDPEFDLLRRGLFEKGGIVDFKTFRQRIGSIETGAASDGRGLITLKCRSAAVQALKRRRGAKTMRNTSPSGFVAAECKAAGIRYVVEPTAKRKYVSRDTGSGTSSWSTFERLSQEVGFVLFEAADVVYFGKPSWLAKRDTQIMKVTYGVSPSTDTIGVPRFVDSYDNNGVQVAFDIERERLTNFMPGQRVHMAFTPYSGDTFLVDSLSVPLAGEGLATVSASKPVDPKPAGVPKVSTGGKSATSHTSAGSSKSGRSGSGSRTKTLGDLLHAAGFRGHALDVACGIAIAESGGFANGRWYVRAGAIGDVGLESAKWGPSVGCFQIRSLRHPFAYGGLDRRRIRSKLTSAPYNARTAFLFSGGGKNWGAWSTYHSGAYRRGIGKTGALVKGWAGGTTHGTGDSGRNAGHRNTTPTGRKSAHDFVAIALKQAGDRYVWGAEASIHNPNPSAFDCSELIQWAAGRVGCYMPDGSSNQHAYLMRHRAGISIDRGLATRGAVLWIPGHVAISLGGHKGTIEATNRSYGVRTWSTHRSFRWHYAGRIPGMHYG